MKTAQKILELETLLENVAKKEVEKGLLRKKVLLFISIYENLSVSMIIEKLGIKKSNFALMTAQLEKEGCVITKKTDIDRRCRCLSLTEKGKAELDDYLETIENRFSQTSMDIDSAFDILLKYLNRKV